MRYRRAVEKLRALAGRAKQSRAGRPGDQSEIIVHRRSSQLHHAGVDCWRGRSARGTVGSRNPATAGCGLPFTGACPPSITRIRSHRGRGSVTRLSRWSPDTADRGRVLRRRPEPGTAVGAPTAGCGAGGCNGGPRSGVRRDCGGKYEAGVLWQPVQADGPPVEHYGGQLWTPEAGRRVDFQTEDHEQAMISLGVQSNREITRTRIRVRTAMAAPDP